MNISEIHDFIAIIQSQERSGFSTPQEIDSCLDRASMAVFTYYRPLYATSIEAKEALASFRVKYTYSTDGLGSITLSNASEFVRLLSMDVEVNDPTTPSLIIGVIRIHCFGIICSAIKTSCQCKRICPERTC